VTIVIIVMVDFDLWPFSGRRSKDLYIRYSDSISTISHYYAVIFGGVRSQITFLRLSPESPLDVKAYPVTKVRGVISDYPL
jgi:hypothetical protein